MGWIRDDFITLEEIGSFVETRVEEIRFKRPILQVTLNLMTLGFIPSGRLLDSVIAIAEDKRLNMHDLVNAVEIIRRCSLELPKAQEWLLHRGSVHEYPRIRELCQSS